MVMRIWLVVFLCAAAFALPGASRADTLLIDRVKAERGGDLPVRGMSMAQVEKRYGAPQRKLAPAGGDSAHHPVIHRWVYAAYTVYFERDRVIDAVLNHAAPAEIGPKPAAHS